MIFTAIIEVISTGITLMFSLLPDVETLDSNVSASLDLVVSYMARFNDIMPIAEIFTLLPIVLAFEVSLLSVYLIIYVVGLIRRN